VSYYLSGDPASHCPWIYCFSSSVECNLHTFLTQLFGRFWPSIKYRSKILSNHINNYFIFCNQCHRYKNKSIFVYQYKSKMWDSSLKSNILKIYFDVHILRGNGGGGSITYNILWYLRCNRLWVALASINTHTHCLLLI